MGKKKNSDDSALLSALMGELSAVNSAEAQARADGGIEESNRAIAERRWREAQKQSGDYSSKLEIAKADYGTAQDKLSKATALRDKFKTDGDSQDETAQGRARDNSALESQRSAEIARLRARVLSGNASQSEQVAAAAPANPDRPYVAPPVVDPVVASDSSLNGDQKVKATELLDSYRGAA